MPDLVLEGPDVAPRLRICGCTGAVDHVCKPGGCVCHDAFVELGREPSDEEIAGAMAKRLRLPLGSSQPSVGPSAVHRGSRPLLVVSWVAPDGVPRHAQEWGAGRGWFPGFLDRARNGAEYILHESLQEAADAAGLLRSEDFGAGAPWVNGDLGRLCRAVASLAPEHDAGVGFGPRSPGGCLLRVRHPKRSERAEEIAGALALLGFAAERVPPALYLFRNPPAPLEERRRVARERLASLRAERGELRARFASYDGGDRPMSPPASLMRELGWSAAAVFKAEQACDALLREPE